MGRENEKCLMLHWVKSLFGFEYIIVHLGAYYPTRITKADFLSMAKLIVQLKASMCCDRIDNSRVEAASRDGLVTPTLLTSLSQEERSSAKPRQTKLREVQLSGRKGEAATSRIDLQSSEVVKTPRPACAELSPSCKP